MNVNYFHETYLNYLRKKALELKKIIKLESNNEKWFQGEMVLAFSNNLESVMSSEFYNSDDADNLDQQDWNEFLGNSHKISVECAVYNSRKGVKKVDFLMENNENVILSEIKILWMLKENESNNAYLKYKGVLDDAFRLKNKLHKYYNKLKNLSRFLTLLIVTDSYTADGLKSRIIGEINNEIDANINMVRIDNICSLENKYPCQDWSSNYKIYLMTADL